MIETRLENSLFFLRTVEELIYKREEIEGLALLDVDPTYFNNNELVIILILKNYPVNTVDKYKEMVDQKDIYEFYSIYHHSELEEIPGDNTIITLKSIINENKYLEVVLTYPFPLNGTVNFKILMQKFFKLFPKWILKKIT